MSPLGSRGLIGLNLKGGVGEAGQQEQTRQGGYHGRQGQYQGPPVGPAIPGMAKKEPPLEDSMAGKGRKGAKVHYQYYQALIALKVLGIEGREEREEEGMSM